ncbi:DUF6773 family protein [Pontibacillus salicampi]|uniref:DUF6773 family protein n=1 Tax=Pontibacillus salicampi TaxID=1449801 RepID=A0ABV6LK59_9BACI
MWFRNKQQDERIVNLQNKIYREIYVIIIAICLLSSGYKLLVSNNPNEHATTEIIILAASSVYYLVRSAMLGILSDEVELHDRTNKLNMNTKTVIFSVFIGVFLALVFATTNSILFSDTRSELVYYFLIVFFGTLAFYLPVMFLIIVLPYGLAKRKSDAVNTSATEEQDDDIEHKR